MSDDDEKPLNEKPQLDSNVVCDVSEKPSELNKERNKSGFGGLPAIDTGLLLDVKPEQTALEECFDENPTKINLGGQCKSLKSTSGLLDQRSDLGSRIG